MKDLFAEIVERHLFELNDMPVETVEQKIIDEYLNHLKEKQIHIPLRFKGSLIEDFKYEIRKKVF
jgi:hypothetical protein